LRSAGSKENGERLESVLSLKRSLGEESAGLNRGEGETLRAEEEALVQRAVAGDRQAWRALYEAHNAFAFRVAARFLSDEAEARDVAQDVFVQIFSRVSVYRPAGRFRTYLYRVVANRCLNERARAHHQRRASAGDDDALAAVPDGAGSPEEQLARAQEARRVRAAIARLPERQRMAVILSRFEGLSYEEIAAALETSVSSVESLLFRARQALARDLEER
jgi:RNA polymerase sigma-70 factor (ECF subfamily)